MYELAWHEFNRAGVLTTKRKAFKSAAARTKFAERLPEKAGFYCMLGTRDPA